MCPAVQLVDVDVQVHGAVIPLTYTYSTSVPSQVGVGAIAAFDNIELRIGRRRRTALNDTQNRSVYIGRLL